MKFYEVWLADGAYHDDKPLTYSSELDLAPMTAVSVPLRSKLATAFVVREVPKPSFATKSVKTLLAATPLPPHSLELAKWLAGYYACSLGDALQLLGPSGRSAGQLKLPKTESRSAQSELSAPLTTEQARALDQIRNSRHTTVLLHGETGSGKTRVYLEMANETIAAGRSVIILTPEISLTAQLSDAARAFLNREVLVLHSQLGLAARKKLWRQILEATEPVVIVGARSALFAPVNKLGLVVVDEAHEPAYKQSQSPRYHAVRAASQLGRLSGAKVILGSATPDITDYYLAMSKKAIVRMAKPAISGAKPPGVLVVDSRDRAGFGTSAYISLKLIDAIKTTVSGKKQALVYLNRRGSARLILCNSCGWQMACPNCDIPLIYHADQHLARCHTCGYKAKPPTVCPSCGNSEIIYRSVGTKAIAEELSRLFPEARIRRFDSDNEDGDRIDEVYGDVKAGKVDILVGTQLLAKGLDLPRLGLVGVIAAESSMGMPDFSAEERSFQLLYQIMGRVGRGHTAGQVIVQTLQPDSLLIRTATARDYRTFYDNAVKERQAFGFPPFAYLAQLVCKRASLQSADEAANKLRTALASLKLPIEIIGPTPPFYARRGTSHYSQLILKSKSRAHLEHAVKMVPSGWQINLDPANLL